MSYLIIIPYFLCGLTLIDYAMNCYVMLWLHHRRKKQIQNEIFAVENNVKENISEINLPYVTTQIPVFNEYNVIERCMDAVCAMDYPIDRHEIQILDDSNDSTRELINKKVSKLKAEGYDISVFRRKNRTGFKAGALEEGMKVCKGEYIAIFDADFKPGRDFLKKTIPHFLNNAKVALVQTRWGHLNKHKSLLTQTQAIGIDGHFSIEQSGRCWNGLFMNFNGTAGVWRKESIYSGGGWEHDTLTEDMDLSYRVQLKGWQTVFLPDVEAPAEIPEDIRSFKSQQFRWAKGSVQTAIKLFSKILKSEASVFKKLQSWFHMTHYFVHPMMVTMAVLALPALSMSGLYLNPVLYYTLVAMLVFSMVAPNALYTASIYSLKQDSTWWHRLIYLPFLTIVGVGVAVNNTKAVLEAVLGKESAFIRTPKSGDQTKKQYVVKIDKGMFIEIALGFYSIVSFIVLWNNQKYMICPFIAVYGIAFMFTGFSTLWETLKEFKMRKQTLLNDIHDENGKRKSDLEMSIVTNTTLGS